MKKLFQLFKKTNLTPNGHYLLYCLAKNEHLDLKIPYTTEMHKLKLLGYLDDNHNLTPAAMNVLMEIESSLNQTKDYKALAVDDIFKANVAKYREIFPRGVIDGRALRNGSLELTNRMVWFFQTYPQYTWDVVLSATKSYINSLGEDLTYCKTSKYFIKKDDKYKVTVSLLADWCEAELDEDKEQASPVIGFNKLV